MATPAKTQLDLHLTAAQSAMAASQKMARAYMRWLSDQQRILMTPGGRRRAEDAHAKARGGPCGADLMSGYGRRCHDVDVEKL